VAGFYILWKNKKTIGIKFSIILTSLLTAYLVQNIFNFDTPASFIAFFLVLGFIGSLGTVPERGLSPKLQATSLSAQISKKFGRAGKLQATIVALILIILVPILIYQTNVKPLQASRLGVKGIAISSRVDYRKGLKFFKESLDLGTFTNPEIRLQLAKATINAAISGRYRAEDMKIGLKFAIDEMEKNIKEHPKDVRYCLFLGQLCNLMAQYEAPYIRRAEEVLKKGLELSPERQQIYFELAQTRFLQQDRDGAISLLKEVVELNPNVRESHLNLGMVLIMADYDQEGLEEIDRAYGMGYRAENPDIFLLRAKAHIRLGDYETAIYDYQVAIAYDRKNAKSRFELANVYAKVGDKENARKMAEKAAELDPRFKPQVEAFIKQLEEENED
jgi:tetratricopeptide (TPR) repeat protein